MGICPIAVRVPSQLSVEVPTPSATVATPEVVVPSLAS